MKRYPISGDSEDWPLKLESFRPFSKICPWSMFPIVKFISSGVSANFPWAKTVCCFQVLRLNVLVIGSTFLLVLIVVVCICVRAWHFENLIFWTRFLNAGSSPFG